MTFTTVVGGNDDFRLCVQAPGGIFVEQASDEEERRWLTEEEVQSFLVPTWESCSWTGIGFETGRGRGNASFKANVHDSGILALSDWHIGERPPAPAWHVWAVEIAFPGTLNFIRRHFWFQSCHNVTDDLNKFYEERGKR